jgi:hypothetical protein
MDSDKREYGKVRRDETLSLSHNTIATMLNRIVLAMNVLLAFVTITSNEYMDESKKPSDLSELAAARTAVDLDWDEEEGAAAAAPSFLFNIDDVSSLVVDAIDASQSFVTAVVLPFGPWLLPLLSILVGISCVLGVRPVERLEGLVGIWRCTAAVLIVVLSFWADYKAPTWMIVASAVAFLMGTRSKWIHWTLHRLVDLLFCWDLYSQVFVFKEFNVTILFILMNFWWSGHAILSVFNVYYPMSWLCIAEWAWNSLTFSLVEAIRKVWALAYKAVIAVYTDTANDVETIYSFFYNGSDRVVSYLRAEQV